MRENTRTLSAIALATMLLAGVSLLTLARAQQQSPDHEDNNRLTQQDIARMLPATDMGASEGLPAGHPAIDQSGNSLATAFASAPIPHNPMAPDAHPVGAQTCVRCHSLENVHASHSIHLKAFRAGAFGSGPDAACETCHGPGSTHITDPSPGHIISFTRTSNTPIETQTGTCLACHAGGARQHWAGSIHQSRDLSCTDCHNPMAQLSPEGVLAKSSINEVCATCHQDIRARFNRRSHMPLPEGQMACTDCHNPHGTITKPLLKTDTVNETCYTCHAEKRGPFLFEHAPVRESCLNCHDPHGSNQQTLLVMPLPMLCQQCHTMTRHPNDLQTVAGLAPGQAPDERLIGRACVTCHTNIHGSNNPSGSRFHK